MLQCYNCGGKHLRSDCTRPASNTGGGSSTGKCYVCEQTGHFARQCLNRKPTRGTPAKKPVGDRPRASGRVFALKTTEATQSSNLLQFLCSLCNHEVVVFLTQEPPIHSCLMNV